MFESVLIANRGEIACRIIDTARAMGLRTIAVYSEADRDARHVMLADEAVLIGAAPASESYLRQDRILEAAVRTGAQAIHPGYGFLSENAEFADACERAGFVFVGPPAEAIRAMGSKSAAKTLMANSGVPVVPGYHGTDQSAEVLGREARKIGYPVLLKASAGGGGRGMRLVEGAEGFDEALTSARREAKAAFGDEQMLVEKFITRPRHIEVQVFADDSGNAVHLFERDCSVQRRHQKIIEEAPGFGVSEEQRREMGQAAVDAALAINYRGAGTVEFIADADGAFYFMEMNTRLQVEHPVTEMITSHDLVEWQLRIAAGEHLPVTQDELAIDGHAIEVRIYAEDPERDFLPATGRIAHLRFPTTGKSLRIDTGVRDKDTIGIDYDPLIAKLIVWGRDRPSAVQCLQQALRDTQISGVVTNLDFLLSVARHEAFVRGGVDTGFIGHYRDELRTPGCTDIRDALVLAALAVVLERRQQRVAHAGNSSDCHSPWILTGSWRLNGWLEEELCFSVAGTQHKTVVEHKNDEVVVTVNGESVHATGRLGAGRELIAVLDGRKMSVAAVWDGSKVNLFHHGWRCVLEYENAYVFDDAEDAGGGGLTAPMPGRVAAVKVRPGDHVAPGEALMILEAMKMEHTILAPVAGRIETVHFQTGDLVDDGVELLLISPGDDATK